MQEGKEKCYLQITAGNYLKAATLTTLHSNSYVLNFSVLSWVDTKMQAPLYDLMVTATPVSETKQF